MTTVQQIRKRDGRMVPFHENKIADAINSYVAEFNARQGYAMILATQGDILTIPVVAADSSLDITDALLEGLNAEYVKSKGKKTE